MSDKKSKKMYTDKDFSKDLKDLEKMIKQTKSKQRGGADGPGNNNTKQHNVSGNNLGADMGEIMRGNANGQANGQVNGQVNGQGQRQLNFGDDDNNGWMNEYFQDGEGSDESSVVSDVNEGSEPNEHFLDDGVYEGGAPKESDEGLRRFKIASVDGKPVVLTGRITIKSHQTPLSAAKKLLRSYAKHHGLTENGKTKLKIVYTIQETTKGSKKKVYGPYEGKYYKYNKEEAEKAKASGISFKFKPMVKLHKVERKGGARS
jgi:hypothetical protein